MGKWGGNGPCISHGLSRHEASNPAETYDLTKRLLKDHDPAIDMRHAAYDKHIGTMEVAGL